MCTYILDLLPFSFALIIFLFKQSIVRFYHLERENSYFVPD